MVKRAKISGPEQQHGRTEGFSTNSVVASMTSASEPRRKPTSSARPSPITVAETTTTTTTTTTSSDILSSNKCRDLQCGIVIETGSRHVDRRLHPERPARITAIVEALQRRHLLERCIVLQPPRDTVVNDDCKEECEDDEASKFLSDSDYLRVHSSGYLQRLEKLSCCSGSSSCVASASSTTTSSLSHISRCDMEAAQYDSIFLTPHSLKQAKTAAAALCRLTALATTTAPTRLDGGFAIVRPPGHHAEPSRAGGYCILNNIAIAAQYALKAHSSSSSSSSMVTMDRILIVDYDVHYGNGTQQIFRDNPHVLYFSVHRKCPNFYPFNAMTSNSANANGNGSCHSVGTGAGRGYTVNVAWSSPGMGDAEYLAVWKQLLLPITRQFQPHLVLVSAGFDAAVGDLGQCCVTPRGFGQLTRLLRQCLYDLSRSHNSDSQQQPQQQPAPIVCALEGGYVRSTLGDCVAAVVEELLRNPATEDHDHEDVSDGRDWDDIHPSAARNIQQTIEAQRPFWSCLNQPSDNNKI